MNKYKKLTINIIVLTFILSGGLSTPAFAAASTKNKQKNQDNKNLEIAILSSFEENNYEAWKKYVGENSNLALYITEDKFNKFIQIRNLARSAQHDTALSMSDKFEKELTDDLKSISKKDFKQASLLPVHPNTQKAKNAIDKIKIIREIAEKKIS